MQKIAVVSDDGQLISQHFGRALYYQVFTIEDGKITQTEMRDKKGHHQFASQDGHGHEDHHEAGHGMDAESKDKHFQMAEAIRDCQVLIAGGMGMGARTHMNALNIQVIMTEIFRTEDAVQRWIAGTLVDRTNRNH
ncbi:MAG: dinitrogenase iron-molybdenum cofactor biosynthesis protein [Chloroflexi bacterium HGW-Chloroflexi-10]|nr:MAG: dinitrogenase iron-molybdenum cofactor biosynthesis protein [Chloroflexi bacterium HGW-Chloroflexi-10]